ncbi:MAG: CoA-binding protein [Desulfatiglans sp.]|jgi:acetyltransferase|nr:CoA-binding protein [Desulfatiglans sp.]
MNTLGPFFEPKGIALIGASKSPGFGYGIPIKLKKQGWGDKLYLVNRSGGEIHQMPVYKTLQDIPGPVDLAIAIVPAHAVPDMLSEIGEHGIRHIIIESAGFSEAGQGGRDLQQKAKEVAEEYGIRVIGPNCVGVVNTENGFTSVEVIEESLSPGNIGIIAQSGAFGNVLLDGMPQRGLSVSKAVTLGNRLDVNESDVLEYLHQDPKTDVVIMYLEGIADGSRFRETVSRVTQDKPVLILKSGRTSAGKAATASHTGSMSGVDALYDAMFAQTGAIRADTLEELIELARVFSSQPLPKGPRLGVVTSSGSMGALATDMAVSLGLNLPAVSQATIDRVMDGAPSWMNIKNPLDVGPSRQFAAAISSLLVDDKIDMVLAITVIPFSVVRMLKPMGLRADSWFGNIAEIRETAPAKPLVVCSVGHRQFIDNMSEIAGEKVPVIDTPEMAAKALGVLWQYSKWKAGIDPSHRI